MSIRVEGDHTTGRNGPKFYSFVAAYNVIVLDVPCLVHRVEYYPVAVHGWRLIVMWIKVVPVLVIEHSEPVLDHIGPEPENPIMANGQIPGVLKP